MILKTVLVGSMQVNCYILACSEGGQALIIDPGEQERKIRSVLDRYKLKPALIINTHGHYDHIGCNDKFGVPVYVHVDDRNMLKDPDSNLSAAFSDSFKVNSEIRVLEDEQLIKLDCIELEVIHTPGHTPGGIALLMKKPDSNILFTGDTLFYQGVGRSDLPGGDQAMLERSLKDKLMVLPDNVIIYPGHGPASTIGEERENNPFLN